MVKKKTLTLAKFTLLAAFDGTVTETRLEAMGDRLAEQLRDEDLTITVASEYDDVETTGPMDDDDALAEALSKQFPADVLPVGPCPGVRVLGRNGTFQRAHLTRREDRLELWLGTDKERYPLLSIPAPRLEATAPATCPSCGAFPGSGTSCSACKEHRLRQ